MNEDLHHYKCGNERKTNKVDDDPVTTQRNPPKEEVTTVTQRNPPEEEVTTVTPDVKKRSDHHNCFLFTKCTQNSTDENYANFRSGISRCSSPAAAKSSCSCTTPNSKSFYITTVHLI